MIRRVVHFVLILILPVAADAALGVDPFSVTATVDSRASGKVIHVSVVIPAKHFLYADEFRVSAREGEILSPEAVPEAETVYDKFSEEDKKVYKDSFDAFYRINTTGISRVQLIVQYQGCNESLCFFPQSKMFDMVLGDLPSDAAVPTSAGNILAASDTTTWKSQLDQFDVTASAAGYVDKRTFLSFLDKGLSVQAADVQSENLLQRKGLLLTIVLLLLGGLALNLTPCVLPLIPINLAILGAGAQARTKRQGFALGTVYGAAMAMVYGILGVVVVLTGSKFGALNASPVFNAVIAVVFVVLSLAMFDLVTIDFSRLQGRVTTEGAGGRGRYVLAFSMGAVAALLAGACVAPVVISTLLLATSLYSQGEKLALLLPFLLGVGMGLPWPFAGAGLSCLPKPGRWMNWVKYVFGVLILVFAAYYGRLAYDLYRIQSSASSEAEGGGDPALQSTRDFEAALAKAQKEQRPVFIDFWATWCKNCHAMEATTFKDDSVKARLSQFVVVKYQAELPNQSPAKDVLDQFSAIGLPTYVVLVPRK